MPFFLGKIAGESSGLGNPRPSRNKNLPFSDLFSATFFPASGTPNPETSHVLYLHVFSLFVKLMICAFRSFSLSIFGFISFCACALNKKGVAIYCFEGAGMILALENSVPAAHRSQFPRVFKLTLAVIASLYIAFGISGYVSFGSKTKKIITLNMPPGPFPVMVKVCLCFSLYFTYPGTIGVHVSCFARLSSSDVSKG